MCILRNVVCVPCVQAKRVSPGVDGNPTFCWCGASSANNNNKNSKYFWLRLELRLLREFSREKSKCLAEEDEERGARSRLRVAPIKENVIYSTQRARHHAGALEASEREREREQKVFLRERACVFV